MKAPIHCSVLALSLGAIASFAAAGCSGSEASDITTAAAASTQPEGDNAAAVAPDPESDVALRADDATPEDAPEDVAPVDPSALAQAKLPTAVGACPTFQDGTVTFNPAGGARRVRLFLTKSALTKGGPLVLYWYGTYGQPTQAQTALGASFEAIKAAGGIIAAPVHANSGQFPWLDGGDADYRLADEIVACAVKNGVNGNRVHSLGFSAGALFTTMLSFARSNYIASVATYSGGLQGSRPAYQNAANAYPALILTGGARDNVFGTNFQSLSRALQSRLKTDGHSAIYCDHGGGHSIPGSAYRAAVGQFFLDHPFGTSPSPYVKKLPTALARCTP